MQSLGNGIFIMKIQLAAFDLHVILPVALLPLRGGEMSESIPLGRAMCALAF